jgi:uncharacterized protein YbjT (DUF2867 family)
MSNNYSNVIVAGATGTLGAAFVEALLESPLKFNVHILVRDTKVCVIIFLLLKMA